MIRIRQFLFDVAYSVSIFFVNTYLYFTYKRDCITSCGSFVCFHEYDIVLNNKTNKVVLIETENVNEEILTSYKNKYNHRNKIVYAGILLGEKSEDVTELMRRFFLYFEDNSVKGCVSNFILYLKHTKESELISDANCELQIYKNDDDITEKTYKVCEISNTKFVEIL